MRTLKIALLAGVGLLGAAGLAAAAGNDAHVLNLRLPDGSVEQIRYTGDTPPQVRVAQPAPAFIVFNPFAEMERISAAMDRQEAMMMQQASSLEAGAVPRGLMQVNVGGLPAGVEGFSMVSTVSGNGVCTQSVQYTSTGDGKPAKILTKSSGDCSAAPLAPHGMDAAPVPTHAPAPVIAPKGSRLIQASYPSSDAG
jgi:hypothetical protein